jgi:peptidoglycan/LPS O-acetylase OafA/YrhL
VDFGHLSHKSWPLDALYFFAGFGHQAVIVFFVLSGFLISSTVIRSHVLGKWSWRDYAINRATRLYVVLVPGLLFGFFWDRLGSWLFAVKGIYAHSLTDLGAAVPLKNLTLGTFLGNLLFLQTILCETFGSNGPLWSLANEFWYYVLFPVALGAGLAWTRRRFQAAILLTCLAILIGIFVGRSILIGFLIWLAGCGLVFLYSRVPVRSRSAALGMLCFFSHPRGRNPRCCAYSAVGSHS